MLLTHGPWTGSRGRQATITCALRSDRPTRASSCFYSPKSAADHDPKRIGVGQGSRALQVGGVLHLHGSLPSLVPTSPSQQRGGASPGLHSIGQMPEVRRLLSLSSRTPGSPPARALWANHLVY